MRHDEILGLLPRLRFGIENSPGLRLFGLELLFWAIVILFTIALLAAGLLAQIWFPFAHYAAPAAGAVFLALLYSVRRFRNSQFKYAIWGSRAVAIVLAVWMVSPIAETLRDPYILRPNIIGSEATGLEAVPLPLRIRRTWIQSELEARSGKQLIIVHHPNRDMPGQDWIYNDADIDQSHVVWARDMGYFKNKELLNYYPDRQVWYTGRGDVASLILPYDQVMAPFKLAFEDAARETDSPRVAGVGQQPSSTIAKPVSGGLAEIAAPRSG